MQAQFDTERNQNYPYESIVMGKLSGLSEVALEAMKQHAPDPQPQAQTHNHTHHHYHSRRPYTFWDWCFTPTYVHHHHHYHGGSRRREEQEEDNSIYIIAGIALAAVAIVGGLYLGGDIADYMRASEGRELASEVVDYTNLSQFSSELKTKAAHLKQEADKLFGQVQNQALIRAILKTAMVASAILGVTGCFMTAPPLVLTAVMGLFLSSVAFSIHKGMTWNFEGNMAPKFQALSDQVQVLQRAFSSRTETRS
jgi:hypothetical protein